MAYLTYDSWNELLCGYLFPASNENQPTTLFVDDEVIDELYGEAGGVQSLVSAINVERRSEGQGMFGGIYDKSVGWKAHGGKGLPPAIPLLAVCVLAAARMAAGELSGGRRISSSNYYDRFRDLLGLKGSGSVGDYGDTVPALWGHIEWWMDDNQRGRVGVSTIPANPTPSIIGFALSQALFKQSDRQRLTEFFRAIRLKPDDLLSAAELLVLFRAWAPRSVLSAGAKMMARSDEHSDQLAGILAAAAAHWDGAVRDENGRRLAQIRLRLTFRPLALDLIAEAPDTFPESAEFASTSGERVQLSLAADGWYGALPVPVGSELLLNGLRLRNAAFALALRGDHIHVLHQDPELGGWSSARGVDPMEEHILVVEESAVPEVRRYLDEFGTAGWSATTRPVAGLPTNWSVFFGVRIERPPQRDVRGYLSVLVPILRSRATLWGGLPVGRLRNLYLTGGEPAVLIPTEGESIREVQVRVDAVAEEASSASGVIFLNGRGLTEGDHSVTVGPTQLRFELVESMGASQAAGTGEIGHRVAEGPVSRALTYEAGKVDSEIQGVTQIIGGAVRGGSPAASLIASKPLVLLRQGEAYLLLGNRPGQICRPQAPRTPDWLQQAGLNATYFEAYAPFTVVWVLTLGKLGWRARLAARRPPDMTEPFEGTNDQAVEWMQPFQWEEGGVAVKAAWAEEWADYCRAVDQYLAE